MNTKTIIIADNIKSILEFARLPEALVISINPYVTHDIRKNDSINTRNIKDIQEYIDKDFPTYDELFNYYKPIIEEKLRLRSKSNDSFFQNLIVGFLHLLTPVEYINDIVTSICKKEKSMNIKLAILDKKLEYIFSGAIK